MLVSQLTHVPIADREAMREGPRDSATHLRLAAATPALGQIEIGGRASGLALSHFRPYETASTRTTGQSPAAVPARQSTPGLQRT